MNNRQYLILYITLILISLKCKQENKSYECPYHEIEWNEIIQNADSSKNNKFSVDFSANLQSYLKKLGKGEIDISIKDELDNYSKKITNSVRINDKKYVDKWNALVQDICGELYLYNNQKFSDSTKLLIEKDILFKVKNFYNTINSETTNLNLQPISSPKGSVKQQHVKSIKKLEEMIEVSIQLEENKGNLTSIFLNNKKIIPIATSTKFNPRILVGSSIEMQKITIIKENNDTCYIEYIFDINKKHNFPVRFKPFCN